MDELQLIFENEIIWTEDENSSWIFGDVNGQRVYKIANYWTAFYAYFKPKGWHNFGNHIKEDGLEKHPFYKSVEDAKAGCSDHLKKFGINANSNNKLKS